MQARKAAERDDTDVPPVPVTVRQLEALVRISESLARMALQVSERLLAAVPAGTGSARLAPGVPVVGVHGLSPACLPDASPAFVSLAAPAGPSEGRCVACAEKQQGARGGSCAQTTATLEHVEMAIELFRRSTMDAVKSGVATYNVASDPQVRPGHESV